MTHSNLVFQFLAVHHTGFVSALLDYDVTCIIADRMIAIRPGFRCRIINVLPKPDPTLFRSNDLDDPSQDAEPDARSEQSETSFGCRVPISVDVVVKRP
jgi:hypothetical protein